MFLADPHSHFSVHYKLPWTLRKKISCIAKEHCSMTQYSDVSGYRQIAEEARGEAPLLIMAVPNAGTVQCTCMPAVCSLNTHYLALFAGNQHHHVPS
jgi:hypothetical protein